MIQVGIVGATGYVGAELVRLLSAHPQAQIAAVSSVTFQGKPLSGVYPSYYGLCDMECVSQEEVVEKAHVVFAALPHGLSQELAAVCMEKGKIMIDMGADFRLEQEADYQEWYGGSFLDKALHHQAVYGLPELFREQIAGKRLIANPGCYTTAVPLAIGPAVQAGLVEKTGLIADCKSGVTGAGRGLTQNTHFAELNEGLAPYKVAAHRHTPEIEQTLSHLAGEPVRITFVPHLLPVNRGILATVYGRLVPGVTEDQLRQVYEGFYRDEGFVRLLPKGRTADIKLVKYSNYCDVSLHLDPRTNTLIAVSALDNMVKGAAGQAIQNMNIVCGLPEDTGLCMLPPAF